MPALSEIGLTKLTGRMRIRHSPDYKDDQDWLYQRLFLSLNASVIQTSRLNKIENYRLFLNRTKRNTAQEMASH